jgi:hypothetical protein
MQRLEVSGAVRPIYGSLGAKGLRISSGVPASFTKYHPYIIPWMLLSISFPVHHSLIVQFTGAVHSPDSVIKKQTINKIQCKGYSCNCQHIHNLFLYARNLQEKNECVSSLFLSFSFTQFRRLDWVVWQCHCNLLNEKKLRTNWMLTHFGVIWYTVLGVTKETVWKCGITGFRIYIRNWHFPNTIQHF